MYELVDYLIKGSRILVYAHVFFVSFGLPWSTYKQITLSSKTIEFIREIIGFKSTIITDAIEMCALHGDIDARYHALKTVTNIEKSQPIPQEHINTLLDLDVINDDFTLPNQDSQSKYLGEQYD